MHQHNKERTIGIEDRYFVKFISIVFHAEFLENDWQKGDSR